MFVVLRNLQVDHSRLELDNIPLNLIYLYHVRFNWCFVFPPAFSVTMWINSRHRKQFAILCWSREVTKSPFFYKINIITVIFAQFFHPPPFHRTFEFTTHFLEATGNWRCVRVGTDFLFKLRKIFFATFIDFVRNKIGSFDLSKDSPEKRN